MNPQYVQPQPYGMPPQNYPPVRTSPALGSQPTTQAFQNVPLGPPKTGTVFPPASTGPPGGLPPPNARPSIPPNQLPPGGRDQRSPHQFGPPPTSNSVSTRPPQVMNGAGFGPAPPPPTPPNFQNQGVPSNKSSTNVPPPDILNHPVSSGVQQLSSPSGLPPQLQQQPGKNSSPPQQPLVGSQQQLTLRGGLAQPPLHQQPPSGGLPLSQQSLIGRPSTQQTPTDFKPAQHSLGGPASHQQPPTGLQPQPPLVGLSHHQPPTGFHQPQPSLIGPSHQQPPTGPPPQQQVSAGPPLSQQLLPGLSPPRQPPTAFSTSQQVTTGPHLPVSQQQRTTNQANLQHSMGSTSLPQQQQQPPIGFPPLQQQPPQSQAGGFPPAQQIPRPNQTHFPGSQPPLNHQPPVPGQLPHTSQFGQRPSQNQFSQPPLPGALPGQQLPLGPNQLNSQMQGMNLSGPAGARQYPGAPKGTANGDNTYNGPQMPPPMNQQQYINGQQQMRGPQAPGGYPPMPGQPGVVPALGGYPQPGYQQSQQQPKRLDPDQMPSPIQVTQDDQQNRSGVFCTNQKGLVPPLVTTNFVVQDQGNASPRFIRSSMYNVPISQDIMKQTAVPFSLVVSPMARTVDQEYEPPIVNFGDLGPVRCIRCKAYMCPFMQFIDSGRRFQCLFCKATTDVPNEYFQHLDHTGQRLDKYERPELVLGTYEFVATQEYCRNNQLPKPPAIIFVIDVSYNNIKSGLVNLLCSQIKEIIQHLPIDQGHETSNMRVGFITYNSSVHFYNIKGNLAAPQMLIVGDIQEMFMPLLDGFLCTPEESGPVIDSLMQQIPQMFGETRETETILLPAILAGLEALKASECAGKLMVFHSSLPTAEGPGKLKNRDDRKLLGTDKEKTVLIPQTQAYNQLGQDCVGAGCSVDLFLFNNAYIDVATIGQVSRLTGGEVRKYTYFQADIDGDRLIKDIITNISRPIAFDSIMRVRTSTGVRPTDFYGHFFMSNTTDMELAAIDCDKAVAIEVKHDDKLSEDEGVYIQAALLYTSVSGQRRLRIINLSLKTCSQMADLYRNCDCDTIINYIAKQSTYKLFEHNPKAVKDNIVTRAAQILATYRKNCASPSSAGQLILPECMKLLPLYVNCLLKSDALSGGSEMTLDDRSFIMQAVLIMDIPTSVNYFYPRLIPLIDLDPSQDPVEIPASIRCTIDKMNEQGVYILENGIHMFLWIGLGAKPDFIQQVFGVPSAIQVDIEKIALPELNNPLSKAVRSIIEEIRIQRHRYMRLTLVRQREKLEIVYKHFLAEDRGTDGSASYVDFLIHMHKEIRTLLS